MAVASGLGRPKHRPGRGFLERHRTATLAAVAGVFVVALWLWPSIPRAPEGPAPQLTVCRAPNCLCGVDATDRHPPHQHGRKCRQQPPRSLSVAELHAAAAALPPASFEADLAPLLVNRVVGSAGHRAARQVRPLSPAPLDPPY